MRFDEFLLDKHAIFSPHPDPGITDVMRNLSYNQTSYTWQYVQEIKITRVLNTLYCTKRITVVNPKWQRCNSRGHIAYSTQHTLTGQRKRKNIHINIDGFEYTILMPHTCRLRYCTGKEMESQYNVIIWNKSALLSLWAGNHWWPVDFPHKETVTWTLDVSFLPVWTNCWTNTRLTGNLRRHGVHLTSLEWIESTTTIYINKFPLLCS